MLNLKFVCIPFLLTYRAYYHAKSYAVTSLHRVKISYRAHHILVLYIISFRFMIYLLSLQVVMTLTQTGFVVSELVALYAVLSTTITGLANPFIYLALSRQYRRGYISIVTGCLKLCCPIRFCKNLCIPGQSKNHLYFTPFWSLIA